MVVRAEGSPEECAPLLGRVAVEQRALPPVFSQAEFDVFIARTILLAWLMMLQSVSGFILEHYSSLVRQHHQILTYCLTFLVGTGGNASAQTTTIVVRGLATGDISQRNQFAVLSRETLVGLGMGCILSFVGFLRVFFFSDYDFVAAFAIALCLLFLCVIATAVSAVLPLLLHRMGKDPAHSSPIAAVLMDIIGCTVSCMICTAAFTLLPDYTRQST